MEVTVRQFNIFDHCHSRNITFLDASFDGQDEHPNGNIQVGQQWVTSQLRSLFESSSWKNSVLFLTYDENGGFFDHAPPPPACAPDQRLPQGDSLSTSDLFDRYGFRVPFVAISPYVKHHYVSHTVFDHTSILKFIENKYNLPALTSRDANADGFSDIFDYSHPILETGNLPTTEPNPERSCN